jgi:hypothetical protein
MATPATTHLETYLLIKLYSLNVLDKRQPLRSSARLPPSNWSIERFYDSRMDKVLRNDYGFAAQSKRMSQR